MLLLAGTILAALLYLLATPAATGRVPTPIRPIPPEVWTGIQTVYEAPSASIAPTAAPTPTATPTRRPAPTTKPTTKPKPAHSLAGNATWFCLPGTSACTSGYSSSGMYAAAGSELRNALGSGWRGRKVTVYANGRSVTVTLIDTCGCSGARVVDLYSAAFRQLAPLSSGVIRVQIRW